jgi:choline monooxygenase
MFSPLDPAFPLSEITDILNSKVGFLKFQDMVEDSSRHRIYLVKAHWALYCDNYLEGFHIPFVHPGLNSVLDPKDYKTELHQYVNIQVGIADEGTEYFDLPKDHEDYGKKIAAYYFWIFPNLMLNFYPWGLSINVVRPVSIDRTKVEYLTFVLDPQKIDQSAGAELDKVEREDEEVVESVQKGMSSRFYQKGRFSPSMEKGVHHFHTLLAEFLK